ncbi:MAG: hypothetical protein JO222_10265 [Frankiales bacterium]|nr:hypothetical protein [Frankiales bacterium]
MRARLCALAAVSGLAVAAFPAHAATTKPKPQITDPTGDANGINGQSIVNGLPSVGTGPAEFAPADITSVTFASTFTTKKVHGRVIKTPTGFTLTLALAAAPTDPEVEYRVSAAAAGCTNVFFEYGTDVATHGSDVRCPASVAASKAYTAGPAKVSGNTITWTLSTKAFPVGTTFSSLNAQTRFNPAIITAPAFDDASSSGTFTVGK